MLERRMCVLVSLRTPPLSPEAANSLAVEPHVLGIALSACDLMTILDEDADGLGVTETIAAGETLMWRKYTRRRRRRDRGLCTAGMERAVLQGPK